jgi:1,4-alpha-glucan branching enzyme
LYELDFDWQGFDWIDCHDAHNSVLIYQRKGQPRANADADEAPAHLVIALNFTPVPRHEYRVGVPAAGRYREVFNSDDGAFGGSGVLNGPEPLSTEPVHWMNHPSSLLLSLPPLGGIVLQPEPDHPAAAPRNAAAASSTDTDADTD